MKQDFKTFLKTTKGKLTVSCGALLLSWIFLLIQFSGNLSAWLPNESRKAAMNKDIRKYKAEQQVQQAKLKEIDALRKRYRDNIAGCWQVRRDGDPSVLLRQKIETAAKEVELSLENIGSVRTSNINNDLYFAEMDIATSASFESVIRFLGKIRDLKPAVSWRRITMNVAFQRFRPNSSTTVRTTNLASPSYTSTETRLMLNGTLRIIVYDPLESADSKNGKGGLL